jgi:hypothetical protein
MPLQGMGREFEPRRLHRRMDMPCRVDFQPVDDSVSLSAYNELLEKANLATRLLCDLTSEVPERYLKNPELAKWIADHAEWDKRRRAEELRLKKRQQIQAQIDELQQALKELK